MSPPSTSGYRPMLDAFPNTTCCILTSNPDQRLRWRAWLITWDRVKILQYSQKLMHRKRVTSELHDSYFLLMMIKHASPKTPEVTHSDGQLWGDTEWAIELLYNSMRKASQLVWRPVWRPDPLVTRCGRERQHPEERAPRPPVEQLKRMGEKHGYGQ